MADILPIPVGRGSTDAALAASLGDIATFDGKAYRLVRAGAAITVPSASGLVVNTAVSAGAPTWVVTLATANAATVAGVIPGGTEGSTGTSEVQSGDYLWIQVSGACDVTSGAAIAANALVAAVSTAGKIDDVAATAGVGAIGVALESAAGADEATGVFLKGLI